MSQHEAILRLFGFDGYVSANRTAQAFSLANLLGLPEQTLPPIPDDLEEVEAYMSSIREHNERTPFTDAQLLRYMLVGLFHLMEDRRRRKGRSLDEALSECLEQQGPDIKRTVFEDYFGGPYPSLKEYDRILGIRSGEPFQAARMVNFVLKGSYSAVSTRTRHSIEQMESEAESRRKAEEEARRNHVAVEDDWTHLPMPDSSVSIPMTSVSYSLEEYAVIQKGLLPECMEDKWFLYFESGTLHCHRSWTGMAVYAIRFRQTGDHVEVTEIRFNPGVYQGSRGHSLDHERAMALYLVDALLLDKDVEFPLDPNVKLTRALDYSMYRHGQVGRDASREEQEKNGGRTRP